MLKKMVDSSSASFCPSKSYEWVGQSDAMLHGSRSGRAKHTICPSAMSRTWSKICSAMMEDCLRSERSTRFVSIESVEV